jgi:hypothetical protein
MKSLSRWLMVLSAWLIVSALAALPAAANGAPVKVFLNFLPETSNHGPVNASGTATISIGEAWIDLTADGMPQLEDAHYEVWITNAETQEMISLGTFNADADGHVEYSVELDDIPIADYRYLWITVEDEPDAKPDEADDRITIAGVFPDSQLVIVTGSPTPTLAPGATPQPGAPVTLPVTGEYTVGIWILITFLVGLGIASAAVSYNRTLRNQEANIADINPQKDPWRE